jgi:putative transposase
VSKKNSILLREPKEVRFVAINACRDGFRLGPMCRAMRVTPAGYHAWKSRPQSNRKTEELRLVQIIENIHQGSRETYGSPRVHAVLSGKGEACSKGKVARLMRKHGIRAKTKKKFKATTNSKHKLPVSDNVLNRDFEVDAPNRAWAGDITFLWTREGWLYLAVVIDLFSRKVIGWAMEPTMSRELALKALRMAIEVRQPDSGLVSHTDRGSQYASNDYQELQRLYGIIGSMSRKGNCWDNSVVESFFGTLKQEHVFFCDFSTREQARRSVFEWIEGWYNRGRLHSKLGNRSPEEYERENQVA